MKKSDLKSGMVVELRDGRRYVVITNDAAISENVWLDFNNYSENLHHSTVRAYDIIKVYKPQYKHMMIPSQFKLLEESDLIWERVDRSSYLNEISKIIDNMSDEELEDFMNNTLSMQIDEK